MDQIIENRKVFWGLIAVTALCALAIPAILIGDAGGAVVAFLGYLPLFLLGYVMGQLVSYPVIWIQYKNPICPPWFYLGFCRVFAFLALALALITFVGLAVAANSPEATAELAAFFCLPGFFLGGGYANEKVRKRFKDKLELVTTDEPASTAP